MIPGLKSPAHRAALVGWFLVACLVCAGAKHVVPSRDRVANETLDTVLAVGSEWRTQRRSFTWGEMDAEVSRRLRVKRVKVWEAGR